MKLFKICTAFFLVVLSSVCFSQQIDFTGKKINYPGEKMLWLKDPSSSLNPEQALASTNYESNYSKVLNLGVSKNTNWVKFELANQTTEELFIHVSYPVLDHICIYYFEKGHLIDSSFSGFQYPFSQREIDYQDFIFSVPQASGPISVLVQLQNHSQSMLPLSIGTKDQINSSLYKKDLFFGVYAGFILVMLLYNLFIFLSTKDKNYAWYLIYIFSVGITQFTLSGYSLKYLWPDLPWLSKNSVYLCGIGSGLAVVFFVKMFLQVKENLPWFNRLLNGFVVSYLVALLLVLIGLPTLSYNLINLTAGLGVIVLLIAASIIARQGFRPAQYFVVAWTIFIFSIIIFVLKDAGVLPYNDFTIYALPIGSALEVVLLSLALADKINSLIIEKDLARANELEAVKENEKLVLEQNIMLERKVTERTAALENANSNLEVAMGNLKDAQAQLVNQEKMASLGQLTAGIAHEINNPINFVSSNVNPLRRDIDDLIQIIEKYKGVEELENIEKTIQEVNDFKNEIDYDYVLKEVDELLKGIGDGASRTAEIVQSLKNFSRLDEVDSKFADIHEGIDSTLVIIISGTKYNVNIIKNYDTTITPIECYPGKLNQVISNIVVNAIQAMNSTTENPTLTLTTKNLDQHISLSIKDNGSGIPEEVKNKIFEPFFTTKEVGEGTGLGLSIVFSIIELHKGQIEVNSEPELGTEFLITLPKALN